MLLHSRHRVQRMPVLLRRRSEPGHLPDNDPPREQRRRGEERVHLDRDLLPHAARRGFLGRRALGKVLHHRRLPLRLFLGHAHHDTIGVASTVPVFFQRRQRHSWFRGLPGAVPGGAGHGRHQAVQLGAGRGPIRRRRPGGAGDKGLLLQLVLLLHQHRVAAVGDGHRLGAEQRRVERRIRDPDAGYGARPRRLRRKVYRYKRRPLGHCSSPLTRVVQGQFRFFDKAAIVEKEQKKTSLWKLCRVSQVEELKMLLRMCPVWASLLVFFAATAQMSSTLVEQGMAMDTRVLGGLFTVPPASLSTFDIVSVFVWVPLYDALLVPLARRATGESRGFTQLQRIGVGLALSASAMAYAARVEAWRLSAAAAAPETEKRMSIMWQAPCYFVMGAAEVFASIGMLEYFYDQSPEAMKSLGTALAQLAIAGGNYLNSALLGAVASATGWITDDLDEGHLDCFFWFMAALGVVNLLQFIYCSTRHKG